MLCKGFSIHWLTGRFYNRPRRRRIPASDKTSTAITDLQLWLLEALLHANAANEIEAHQLLRLPELYPFSITTSLADLRKYQGFNIHRQGLDMDMIALQKDRSAATAPKKKNKQPKPKQPLVEQQKLFANQDLRMLPTMREAQAEVDNSPVPILFSPHTSHE